MQEDNINFVYFKNLQGNYFFHEMRESIFILKFFHFKKNQSKKFRRKSLISKLIHLFINLLYFINFIIQQLEDIKLTYSSIDELKNKSMPS